MPVYNGGHYFKLALESALRQTYERFEIIVVDDGSNDEGEAERVTSSAGKRARYIYQENQGVAGALNTALANMRGDVFCWLSHDDLFEPFKLEAQEAYHRKLAKHDAVLFSDYDVIDPQGNVLQRITADRKKLVCAPILALLTGSINGCTIYAPMEVMHEIGPFDGRYRYTQDYRLWNHLLRRFDFFHIPQSLVRYRQHLEQGSNHPQAVLEAEGLWIDMMKDRCEAECVHMMGSTLLFYEAMAEHLSLSPYRKAEAFAREQATVACDATTLSLIVPVTSAGASNIGRLMDWVENQSHQNVDLLVAVDTSTELRIANREKVRVLYFSERAALSEVDLINRALPETYGSYVAIARPTEEIPDYNIHAAVTDMQRRGLTVVASSLPTAEGIQVRDVVLRTAAVCGLRLEDVIIHRLHIDGGFTLSPSAMSLSESVALLPLFAGGVLPGLSR
jgi:hypothetical protein